MEINFNSINKEGKKERKESKVKHESNEMESKSVSLLN